VPAHIILSDTEYFIIVARFDGMPGQIRAFAPAVKLEKFIDGEKFLR
jgi:hypothetical protein